MKKRNLAAKIFLGLFFFTMVTALIAIGSAKIAHNRDPDFMRKVAIQVENRLNKGETKPFSETNEQDLKGIRQITIRSDSTDIEVESYEGTILKLLYEGDMRKEQEGTLIDAENRNGEVVYRLARVDNRFVSLVWNGSSKGIIKSDSNVRAKLLIPKNYTGDLAIHLGSGDVDVEGVTLRNLTVKIVNGDVELEKVQGQALEISGTSGDLHAEASSFRYWSIKKTNGDIHLALLPTSKYIFEAKNVNGDLKVDAKLIAQAAEEKKADKISIKLINGDIQVEPYIDDGQDRE